MDSGAAPFMPYAFSRNHTVMISGSLVAVGRTIAESDAAVRKLADDCVRLFERRADGTMVTFESPVMQGLFIGVGSALGHAVLAASGGHLDTDQQHRAERCEAMCHMLIGAMANVCKVITAVANAELADAAKRNEATDAR